jgi:hypothetical protein
MGILDKAKAAAEQAAAKAKEGVEDVQQKRELGQAYSELGKTVFELVESGELSHPLIEPVVARIRSLTAAGDATPAAAGADAEQHDPDGPPAPSAA